MTIRQANVYGLCAGCATLLPAELRASPPTQPLHGAFESNGLKFQVIRDNAFAPGLRNELTEDELDQILRRSERLPDLGNAPVSSWMLARLAKLTSGKLGFPLNDKQRNDGGGFAIDFLVSNHGEQRIAAFQLQGDTIGAAILGHRVPDCSPQMVIQAVTSALLAAPSDLMPCQLAVSDPEWQEDPEMYSPRPKRGAKNWYGWDGARFLGENNITEC